MCEAHIWVSQCLTRLPHQSQPDTALEVTQPAACQPFPISLIELVMFSKNWECLFTFHLLHRIIRDDWRCVVWPIHHAKPLNPAHMPSWPAGRACSVFWRPCFTRFTINNNVTQTTHNVNVSQETSNTSFKFATNQPSANFIMSSWLCVLFSGGVSGMKKGLS